MYIWNLDALARDIRSDHIGFLQKFIHAWLMLAIVVLCWFGLEDDSFSPMANALWIGVAQAVAIHLCYCANTQGDRRNFWSRLCMLGVPMALRWLCLVMALEVLASMPPYVWRAAMGNASETMQLLSGLPHVVVLSLGILLWGWRVSVHMERIARACARDAEELAQ